MLKKTGKILHCFKTVSSMLLELLYSTLPVENQGWGRAINSSLKSFIHGYQEKVGSRLDLREGLMGLLRGTKHLERRPTFCVGVWTEPPDQGPGTSGFRVEGNLWVFQNYSIRLQNVHHGTKIIFKAPKSGTRHLTFKEISKH